MNEHIYQTPYLLLLPLGMIAFMLWYYRLRTYVVLSLFLIVLYATIHVGHMHLFTHSMHSGNEISASVPPCCIPQTISPLIFLPFTFFLLLSIVTHAASRQNQQTLFLHQACRSPPYWL